ncbi:MAG: glycosyltransferase [Bacteroidales bacterium]|nr:glycosyltransferase [Bacteroidales bacterium]
MFNIVYQIILNLNEQFQLYNKTYHQILQAGNRSCEIFLFEYMNVLMIIDGLGAGGVERRMISLIKHLLYNSNYKIQVVVLSTNVHYDYKALDSVKFHFIRRWPKKDLRVFFRIYSICRIFKPEIIHVWGSQPAIYSIPAKVLLKIKMVNSMINDAPVALSFKQWCRSKITFPFSDAIVSNSVSGINVYHPKPQKSHVIYNGFDFTRLKDIPDVQIVKRKYGIGEDKIVVGMVARFENHKDYATFLAAAQLISKGRKDVVFLLVGDGKLLTRFKLLYQTDIGDNLIFMGRQKEVENIISTFDIGVLATFTEGISNSVMEYMALKKPVVATDCPGNREIVVNEVTGYLVPAKRSDSLYEKIVALLENKNIREQFGLHGFQRLQKHFSIEIMASSFLALYDNLRNEKGPNH